MKLVIFAHTRTHLVFIESEIEREDEIGISLKSMWFAFQAARGAAPPLAADLGGRRQPSNSCPCASRSDITKEKKETRKGL